MYYLDNGREFEFNNDLVNRVSKSSGGVVYRISDDKCIKLYYRDTYFRIEKEIFDLMKELNLSNFCKLGNMVYSNESRSKFIGYTMNYYDTIKDNILLMSSDYIIDNFNRLYDSFVKLSNNHVVCNDTRFGNCIIGNNITIIDFDFYSFSDLTIPNIKEINISRLMLLFNKICYHYYELLYGVVSDDIEYRIDDIFCYCNEPVKRLSKIFNNKRVIDVIKKES